MSTKTLTIQEFLEARWAEEETRVREALSPDFLGEKTFYDAPGGQRDSWGLWTYNVPPDRILADIAAKRAILEFHKQWPILVNTPPKLERADETDPSSMAFRMTQQIRWMTEQEYRERFGDEPPTGPVLRALASVYRDHPDFREEWDSD